MIGLRAVGAQQQQGRAGQSLHQCGQQLEGQLVGPVQVLQHQRQRPAAGHGSEQPQQGPERPLPDLQGPESLQALVPLRAEADRQQTAEKRGGFLQLLGGQQSLFGQLPQAGLDAAYPALLGVCGCEPEVSAQDLQEGAVARGLPELLTAPAQPQRRLPARKSQAPLPQLADQPRLAQAGLADQDDDLALPLHDPPQGFQKAIQLRLAAHQRRRPALQAVRLLRLLLQADRPIGDLGLGSARPAGRAHLVGESPSSAAEGRGADQHLPGCGHLAQAGGPADRRAPDGRRFPAACGRRHQEQAGVEPRGRLQTQLPGLAQDRQGRQDGPLRVIFAGSGHTEQGHEVLSVAGLDVRGEAGKDFPGAGGDPTRPGELVVHDAGTDGQGGDQAHLDLGGAQATAGLRAVTAQIATGPYLTAQPASPRAAPRRFAPAEAAVTGSAGHPECRGRAGPPAFDGEPQLPGLGIRFAVQLFSQDAFALPVLAQGGGPLPAGGVQPHQQAMRLLLEGIHGEPPPGVGNGPVEAPVGQEGSRQLP